MKCHLCWGPLNRDGSNNQTVGIYAPCGPMPTPGQSKRVMHEGDMKCEPCRYLEVATTKLALGPMKNRLLVV